MGRVKGDNGALARFLRRPGFSPQAVQPFLTLISIAGAISVISILLVVVLRSFLPPRGDPEERELEHQGEALIRVRETIREGLPLIRSLREQAFISHRIPDQEEPSEVQRMRRQVEEWDQAACTELIRVWEWLKLTEEKEKKSEDRLTALHHRIHRFVVALDLLDNRPASLPLPRALALYRYKSTDFVRSSVISDFEFEQVLNGYGFDDDEVRAIDAWVDRPLSEISGLRERYPELAQQGKRLRDLPARDFVEALRDVIGVSALHERKILPPEVERKEELEELFRALRQFLGRRDLGGWSPAGSGSWE